MRAIGEGASPAYRCWKVAGGAGWFGAGSGAKGLGAGTGALRGRTRTGSAFGSAPAGAEREPPPVICWCSERNSSSDMTQEATALLEAFGQEAERLGAEASGLYAGTLGKARGHALRLACVVEHLWWAATDFGNVPPEAIGEGAMQAAVRLMRDYFIPSAERVFGDAAIPVAEHRAMHLAKHLRRLKLKAFNARDLRRTLSGPLREPKHMDEACEGLTEANLIRLGRATSGPQGGRPAKIFEVHPAVHRGQA